MSILEPQPPSFIEIGLEASRKGNFETARQMFHAAMELLEREQDKELRLIEPITNIADTYFNEGCYGLAKQWYEKALHYCDLSHGRRTFQAASLMSRLAELNVLQSEMTEFEKCFEKMKHIYLLSQETDASKLLHSLIDLSWAL